MWLETHSATLIASLSEAALSARKCVSSGTYFERRFAQGCDARYTLRVIIHSSTQWLLFLLRPFLCLLSRGPNLTIFFFVVFFCYSFFGANTRCDFLPLQWLACTYTVLLLEHLAAEASLYSRLSTGYCNECCLCFSLEACLGISVRLKGS
jgi:hypothetical protein